MARDNKMHGFAKVGPRVPIKKAMTWSDLLKEDKTTPEFKELLVSSAKELDQLDAVEKETYQVLLHASTKISRQQKMGSVCVSDVVDRDGSQYVDLVIGGGGMFGPAIAGYLHALESAGIRFCAIAGTSLGALSATLLAAIDEPCKPKALRLASILCNLPVDDFVQNRTARKLLRLRSENAHWIRYILPIFFAAIKLLRHRYLIDGKAYECWIERTISRFHDGIWDGFYKECDNRFLEFKKKDIPFPKYINPRLSLVAADVTREKIVELPEEEDKFSGPVESLNLASYVRASTAIPLMFRPLTLERKNNCDAKKSVLVDGGLMSTFPMSIFNHPKEEEGKNRSNSTPYPGLPTFGVNFTSAGPKNNPSQKICQYIGALIMTALDVVDEQFLELHPGYKQVVTSIDTEDYDRFNIYLTPEEQLQLFELGMTAGNKFLVDFDWPKYTKFRQRERENLS